MWRRFTLSFRQDVSYYLSFFNNDDKMVLSDRCFKKRKPFSNIDATAECSDKFGVSAAQGVPSLWKKQIDKTVRTDGNSGNPKVLGRHGKTGELALIEP